jgi:hypothetical protein
MTLHKILPPPGWVILKRDGWCYPARILTESPRTYFLIWRHDANSPCHYQWNCQASDAAMRFYKGLMRHAQLRPLDQREGYVIHTEECETHDSSVVE